MADLNRDLDESIARFDAYASPRKLNGHDNDELPELPNDPDRWGPAEGEAKPKPIPAVRQPMQWAKLEEQQPPERIWRLAHWLSAGPTLFAGRGGVGKSMVAQTVATAFALAQNYIDEIAEPITVLYWACEDDHDELWRRQVAVCNYFGIKLSELEGKLVIEPRLGCENTLYAPVYGTPTWTSLRDELREQMNDYKADLLIADNTSHLYGCNENSRHEVTSFINGLSGLVKDRPTSQLILSHPAKAGDSEFSGSTAWENAVRMRWFMGATLPDQPEPEEGEDDPNVRYIAKRKTNYSVRDYRKLIFADGVFKPEQKAGPIAQRFSYAARSESAERCVMVALRKINAAGVRAVAAYNSGDYLVKHMKNMKLMQDHTEKEITGALAALRLSGRVVEAKVGNRGNRSPQFGLVVDANFDPEDATK